MELSKRYQMADSEHKPLIQQELEKEIEKKRQALQVLENAYNNTEMKEGR